MKKIMKKLYNHNNKLFKNFRNFSSSPFSKTSPLGKIFSKVPVKKNMTSLVPKKLILDSIPLNTFFYSKIFQEYKNKELAEYLAKYLTFWLRQKNKHGSYFLDHYRAMEDISSLVEGTYGEVEDFGSPFSNTEITDINELPLDREEICIVQLLGEKVKFKKINHFLNFFEILNTVVSDYNVKFTGKTFGYNELIKNGEVFSFNKKIFLLKFPKVNVEFFTFPTKGQEEKPGYFFIDWDKTNSNITSYLWDLNKNVKNEDKIIQDYFQFLDLLNIGIWVEQQDVPHYYQFFQELKIKIKLEYFKDETKNQRMSKIQILEYLDNFLNILAKSLSNKNKILAFLKINKKEIIKKNIKNRFKDFKMKIKTLDKKLLLPLFLGISLIFYIRFLFPILFFAFLHLFLITMIIKNRNKRRFPSFNAYFFDLKENFTSRLSIKSIFLIYLILRLLVIIKITPVVDNMSPLYMMPVKKSTEQKVLAKTLSIVTNKEANLPFSMTETGILLNKTSLGYTEEYRRIAYFETYRNNQIFSAWQNSRTKRNEFFPAEAMIKFPWKNRVNCVYPSLMETETGLQFSSFQEISEIYYPLVASYTEYNFKNNLSSVIYENNIKIEGEFILNNTVCDVKAPKLETLNDPESMFAIPLNLKRGKAIMAKAIQIIKQDYHYLLILDVTHLELTPSQFLGIKKAFKNMILKHPEIFGNWESRRCNLIFKENIPGLPLIKTNVTEAILQNYSLIKSLEIYDDLIIKAESLAISRNNGLTKESNSFNFKTLLELEKLLEQEKYDPIKEIRSTNIIETCRNFPSILQKPQNWFTGIPYLEGIPNKKTPDCLETSKFLKNGETKFEETLKERFFNLPDDVKNKKKLEVLGDITLENGEVITQLSTHKLKPLPETRMVVYDAEFAKRQKWRSEKSVSTKGLEELYPELKKNKKK